MPYNRLNFHKKTLHLEFSDITLKMAVDALPYDYSKKDPRLRSAQIKLPLPKNTICLNSFNFRAGQAWNRLPLKIKNADTVESFKNKISNAKIYWSCKLCSIF